VQPTKELIINFTPSRQAARRKNCLRLCALVSNQQKEVIINFTPSRQAARRKNCFASLRLSEQPAKRGNY
jgi:hypothetical protein